jgi:hypothetical protein
VAERDVRLDREDVEFLCGLLRHARSKAIEAGGALAPFLGDARAGAAADRDRADRIHSALERARLVVARVPETAEGAT